MRHVPKLMCGRECHFPIIVTPHSHIARTPQNVYVFFHSRCLAMHISCDNFRLKCHGQLMHVGRRHVSVMRRINRCSVLLAAEHATPKRHRMQPSIFRSSCSDETLESNHANRLSLASIRRLLFSRWRTAFADVERQRKLHTKLDKQIEPKINER